MGVEQDINQGDPLHILVIDADTQEAVMLKDILTPDGFEVEICDDPEAAGEILRMSRADIVIEGEGIPVRKYDVGLNIVYQQRIDDMRDFQRAFLMAGGILPIGKDPLLLEESVISYGFLRKIRDTAAQALINTPGQVAG